MRGKRSVQFMFLLMALLLLSSCGGGPVGFATSGTNTLDSDVAVGTNAATQVCTGFTVLPDSTTVTLNLVAQPKATTVIIDKVDISFTPANTTSPALNPEFALINQPVAVGTSGTTTAQVTFPVVSQAFKMSVPLSNLVCSNTIYSYYVTMTFSAHDFNSGDTVNIDPARMNINFADFK